jgi:hypothetical protein
LGCGLIVEVPFGEGSRETLRKEARVSLRQGRKLETLYYSPRLMR